MSWSWTLYRYLAIQFFLGVAVVYTGFLALAFSIDIVNLLNRTTGHGVTTSVIVGMAMLQLPDLGQKMLPFAILLGGVFTFARLSRSQELVATRAAGVSAWDFLLPPLAVAVLIGVTAVTVFTPISARMFSEFAGLEARYVKGEESQLSVSENGLWLRQGDEKPAIGDPRACALPIRASIWRKCWSFFMAPMTVQGPHRRRDRRNFRTMPGCSRMPRSRASTACAGASRHLPAGNHAHARPDPGKLRFARHAILLGSAGLYPRRPSRRFLRHALSALSLHALRPARSCSRRWCSWRRAFRCVWRARAAWRK